jgi:hypothetical protein
VARITDDDHARATEKIREGLHESFPNADVNTREDFIAPILNEARARLAEQGQEKPDEKPAEPCEFVGAPQRDEMDDELDKVRAQLAPHGIGAERITPQNFAGAPPAIEDSEQNRAIGARIRWLMKQPAWMKRITANLNDNAGLSKIMADADEAFGNYLDCYRRAMENAAGVVRMMTQAPGAA